MSNVSHSTAIQKHRRRLLSLSFFLFGAIVGNGDDFCSRPLGPTARLPPLFTRQWQTATDRQTDMQIHGQTK